MVFLNSWLIGLGLLAIGVPIVLHFMARNRPKPTPFPTIRFLSEAIVTNRRRVRLKQWILLALRVACLAWLALSLAHPSVSAGSSRLWGQAGIWGVVAVGGFVLATAVGLSRQNRSRWWLIGPLLGGAIASVIALATAVYAYSQSRGTALLGEQGPVAAILIFDVAPRMEYLNDGQTRMQVMQELGDRVLAELPEESRAAVVDTSPATPFFAVDLSAARRQVESLEIRHVHQSLPARILQAARLFDDQPLERREIYVFTDRSREAWPSSSAIETLSERLKESEFSLYLIDVRAERDDNLWISSPQLVRESITVGSQLELSVDVFNRGEDREVTLELELEKPDPSRPSVRDGEVLLPEQFLTRSTTLNVPAGGSASTSMSLPDLPLGVHQGRIRLRPLDAMEWDNVRHFTVEVRSPWKCLVFSDEPTRSSVLTEAIAPTAERLAGRSIYEFQQATFEGFGKYPLGDYDAVFLVDPAPIDPATWELLLEYVSNGGSVAIFLGARAELTHSDNLGYREIDPSFRTAEASRLLPGIPTHVWYASELGVWLTPRDFAHPLLSPLRGYETTVPWRDFPVRQHWGWEFSTSAAAEELEEGPEESDGSAVPVKGEPQVVLSFSDGAPAVIQASVGEGSVTVWTTPVGESVGATSPDRWNQLTVGDCWPYFLLVNQLANTMVSDERQRLNLMAGEVGELRWRGDDAPDLINFFSPLGGEPERLRGDRGTWLVRFTESPGAYRFKGGIDEPRILGFSVNAPAVESDLSPVDDEWWEASFPEGDLQRVRGVEDLRRKQGTARQGKDFFETLALWLPVLMAVEFLFASFSQSRQGNTSNQSAKKSAMKEVAV